MGGNMTRPEGHLLASVREAASAHGLDPAVVAGVVDTESGWNTWAIRYEPAYRWLYPSRRRVTHPHGVSTQTEIAQQKTSWGLLQVMGAVARELGYQEPFLSGLCMPALGLEYGCKHLANLVSRYGTINRALAAYNAGRPTSRRGMEYAARVLEAAETWRPVVETDA